MIFDTPGTRCFRRVVLIMEKKMKMELQNEQAQCV